jgi:hypothetical protein
VASRNSISQFLTYSAVIASKSLVGIGTIFIISLRNPELLAPVIIGQSYGTISSALVGMGAPIEASQFLANTSSDSGKFSILRVILKRQYLALLLLITTALIFEFLLVHPHHSSTFVLYSFLGFLNNLASGLNLSWWFVAKPDFAVQNRLEVAVRLLVVGVFLLGGILFDAPYLYLIGGALPYFITTVIGKQREKARQEISPQVPSFRFGIWFHFLSTIFSSSAVIWASMFADDLVVQTGLADRLVKAALLASLPISQIFQHRVLSEQVSLRVRVGLRCLMQSSVLALVSSTIFFFTVNPLSRIFFNVQIDTSVSLAFGLILGLSIITRSAGIEILTSIGLSKTIFWSIFWGCLVQVLLVSVLKLNFRHSGFLVAMVVAELFVLVFKLVRILKESRKFQSSLDS